jgi:hypothetical protein
MRARRIIESMSWKTINEILALASLDQTFREALQDDPVSAVEAQGFTLNDEERSIFHTLASLPLTEFCQGLLDHLMLPPTDNLA